MFTDVQRSTALLTAVGADVYADLLVAHHELIRSALGRHGGVEVDTQGDAAFAAFPSARQAVAAAREILDGLDGRLRLRIGLHTGEALWRDGRYVGLDVHEAARVAAVAHGGQVLLTAATADLLEPGVDLRDLGLHRLRDVSRPVHLFQLGHDEHPMPESRLRSTFPVPPTSFIGRSRELDDVEELLRRDDVRLVSLVGPGGVGKSRLGLEAAGRLTGAYPARAWWLSLTRVASAADVLSELARAIGLPADPGRALREAIEIRLGAAPGLVVLDNCEHLLPELALDVAWLRDLAGPTVLVTSRERLRLDGEHVYPVGALDGPDAVDLLVSRSAAFGVALDRTAELDELCARLDRLPLALELAAARTPLFTPDELLGRLGERLDLLRGGVEADPRQQTLRATIGWSYDLLDESEQRLFRALGVFADGCRYEAAVSVCGAEPDTLQSLLDKSLVQRRAGGTGAMRFALLHTVREFAQELLVDAGEADAVRDRHAAYLADLGDAAAEWRPPLAFAQGVERLADESQDLRAALAHASSSGDALLRLRLAAAIALVGNQRLSRLAEPRAELEAALAAVPTVPPWLEARVQARIAEASWSLGEWERARIEAERAATLFRSLGDELQLAAALSWVGAGLAFTGEPAAGIEMLRESLAIYHRHGEDAAASTVDIALGCTLLNEGDVDSARAILERADAVDGVPPAHGRVVRVNLALCRVLQGDADGAEQGYREVLAGLELPAEERAACYAVEGLAAAWAVGGRRLADAAALLAAAGRARAELGAVAELPERQLAVRTVASLRDALGEEQYERAVATGRRMSLRRAVARALLLADSAA